MNPQPTPGEGLLLTLVPVAFGVVAAVVLVYVAIHLLAPVVRAFP